MPPVPSQDGTLEPGTKVISSSSSQPSSTDLTPVRMTVAGGDGVGKSAFGRIKYAAAACIFGHETEFFI